MVRVEPDAPAQRRRLAPRERTAMHNLLTLVAIYGTGVATGIAYSLLALT